MRGKRPDLEQRLRAFMEAVIAEANTNPKLWSRLEEALGGTMTEVRPRIEPRRPRRRNLPVLDPFTLYEQGGEELLRKELKDLDIDQLKDIVAAHGMDRSRLALRWRTAERLMELIVETVRNRAHKGEVFRS